MSEQDYNKVICPECNLQFRAIPVVVQERIAELENLLDGCSARNESDADKIAELEAELHGEHDRRLTLMQENKQLCERNKELEHWFHGYRTPEASMAALVAENQRLKHEIEVRCLYGGEKDMRMDENSDPEWKKMLKGTSSGRKALEIISALEAQIKSMQETESGEKASLRAENQRLRNAIISIIDATSGSRFALYDNYADAISEVCDIAKQALKKET